MWETLCVVITHLFLRLHFLTHESPVLCICIVSIPLTRHVDDLRSNVTAGDNMMTAPTDTSWGPSKISKAVKPSHCHNQICKYPLRVLGLISHFNVFYHQSAACHHTTLMCIPFIANLGQPPNIFSDTIDTCNPSLQENSRGLDALNIPYICNVMPTP